MWPRPSSFFTGVADVEAVFLGHHHVEKDQVRLLVADGFERLFAVGGGEQFDAIVFQLFERLLDQHAQMGFVVNNQNLHSCSLIDEEQNVLHAFLEAQRRGPLRYWKAANSG